MTSLGNCHPGLDVFKRDEALTYFMKETIITTEIDKDVELYLESENVILAAEKIFYLRHKSHDNTKTNQCRDSPLSQDQIMKNVNPPMRTRSAVSGLRSQRVGMDSPASSQSLDLTVSLQEGEYNGSNGAAAADLWPLFWLMSVLPAAQASKCKAVLDGDEFRWKVSLNDVIMVFLNWGGSLKSFQLEGNMDGQLTPHSNSMKRNEESTCPDPSTVQIVLHCLTERLPGPSAMSVSDRILLVRVLVYACLDKSQGYITWNYTRAISKVLDSFDPWSQETATVLVKGLALTSLGHKNTVFVCCSVFNLTSVRLQLAGLMACFHVLHHEFGMPYVSTLSALVVHLTSTRDLLQRYSVESIFFITQLVGSVFDRLGTSKSSCHQADLEGLYRWAVDIGNELKHLNVDQSIVRERLIRLSSECNNVTQRFYNNTFKHSVNFILEQPADESPLKLSNWY